MKHYWRRNPALTGYKPTAANAGPSYPRQPGRKGSTNPSREFLLATMMTQKPTKSGYPTHTWYSRRGCNIQLIKPHRKYHGTHLWRGQVTDTMDQWPSHQLINPTPPQTKHQMNEQCGTPQTTSTQTHMTSRSQRRDSSTERKGKSKRQSIRRGGSRRGTHNTLTQGLWKGTLAWSCKPMVREGKMTTCIICWVCSTCT